ncbi:MAG TPA: hypothetical protein VMG35_20375 [Bryobacteraceae bacterium]|nr:hypothetical protein [Bryobacteraceae bacterium]
MRFLLLLACAGSLAGEFRAGAFRKVISPTLQDHPPVYMAGFGHNRVAMTVHDDLYARCLAFSAGRKPLVVCEVDLIGFFLDDVERVRAKVPEADVVVASTHVHEGPDTMGLWGPAEGQSGIDDPYNSFVVDRVAEAAKGALAALEPATPALAVVHSAELDSFIDDDRPPVVHDPDLIILTLTGKDGKRIATAVNWANHPETLGSRNTQISADYPGYFYKRLEARLGGMAVLWNGAVGGMQSPLGAKIKDPATGAIAAEKSFRKTQVLGERIADLAADAIGPAKPVRIDKVAFAERIITIPVTNRGFQMAAQADLYKGRKKTAADGATTAPVGLIRMSGSRPVLEIALVPGEMYPELSVGGVERYAGADYPDAPIEKPIKGMLHAPFKMLIGLADDEIGYIIPKAEWDEKAPYLQNARKAWYGEVNSVGPDAAARIAEAIEELAGGR